MTEGRGRSRSRQDRQGFAVLAGGMLILLAGMLGSGYAIYRIAQPAQFEEPELPSRKKHQSRGRRPAPAAADPRIARERERKARLEARMGRLAEYAQKSPKQLEQQHARWAAFKRAAEGTSYAAYADSVLRSLAPRLRQQRLVLLEDKIGIAEKLAGLRRWDDSLAALDRLPPSVKQDPELRARIRKTRRWITTSRQGYTKASYRIFCAVTNRKITASPGLRVDDAFAVNVVGSSLRLGYPMKSRISFVFPLREVPVKALLQVSHVSAITGRGRYSPIWITINGKTLVGEWSPIRYADKDLWWDVRAYLKPGENRISWRVGRSFSQYWLFRWEISDWAKPPE